MCPNDNPAYAKPLLPRRWDSLFDSEAGSDVEFLVGPEQWRFPGHKTVLAAANPVFEAMLTGPMATHDTTIPIEDVDGRAFENLLRYLYKEDIHMQSIKTALKTLYAAFKYQCGGLVRICIEYLDLQLDHKSVLEIYRHIRIYSDPILLPNENKENSSSQNSTPTPSAPPLESEDSAGNHSYLSGINENIPDAIIYCGALHHNCLQYIDQNASKVLVQEQVEDLDIEVLRLIAERENLDLISERILFDALDRWCNRECKKRRLELTAENRRAVLGQDILFCVRYLLMTPNEFLEGPMQSGLLNQVERSVISAHIRRTPSIPSMHLEGVLVKMRTPRGKMCGEANHLSKRTAPVITHCDVSSSPSGSSARRTGRWGKKKEGKKVVKQKSKSCSPDRDSHKRSTGACFTEYFFSALSCVFD
ncbi:hypothetical protein L9F63_013713 [Diploptera punctata]|uniref:BTB domain-containing protein n=1 Tax=Diploptera punctata TaxID=6984 RepID=A0AAD8AAB4_DIPPU|nr:hypothetical protein L9F63_013713 [Diploptera punctata]